MDEDENSMMPDSPVEIVVIEEDKKEPIPPEVDDEVEKTEMESSGEVGRTDPTSKEEPAIPEVDGEVEKAYVESSREVGRIHPTSEEDTEEGIYLHPELFTRRESVALQTMDTKHSWLAEVEDKYANLETSFISKIQYVALSNHFQKFLDQLDSADDIVPGVRGEFSNLFDKFRTCFVSSQRLRNKLFQERSLKAMNAAESRKWESRIEDGERVVEVLREQLEASRMEGVERGREKAMLQQALHELREEMAKGVDRADSDESLKRATLEDDDEDRKKILDLEETVESLLNEVNYGKERELIFLKKLQRSDQEKSDLQKELTVAKSELQKQRSLREKAEGQVVETNEQLELKREVDREQATVIQNLKSELATAQQRSNSLLKELKKWRRENDKRTQEFDQLRKNLDIREDRIRMLTSQKDSLVVDLNNGQAEIKSLKVEKSAVTKQRNELTRRVSLQEEKIADLEKTTATLKELNHSHRKKVDALEKEHCENDAKVKELTRQKDDMVDEVLKSEKAIETMRTDLKSNDEKLGAMSREMDSFRMEVEKLQNTIRNQNKARERMAADALQQTKTLQEHKSQIRTLELQVSESEKTTGRLRLELEEGAAKYKTLSEDERFYRKSCGDSKRVIEQQKVQLTMLNKTIQQLEARNQDLDEQGKRLVGENDSISDELRAARESTEQVAKHCEALASKMRHSEDQERSLLKTISDLERDVRLVTRKLKNVTQERDALGSKALEKDDQIVGHKERIRLLEHEAGLADKALGDRVADVKLLKLQLSEMNRSRCLMEGRVEHLHATRRELTQLHRELQEQRSTRKGLEGEMQRPVNFHRWRILEGTDPDRAQLVAKTQSLQKELAKKAAESDAKDAELGEKDELIRRLREVVKRRSDTGAEEQLWECKRELRTRTDRLKCLASENNMYENLVAKYRKEVTALREEIRRYKLEEFKSKSQAKKKQIRPIAFQRKET